MKSFKCMLAKPLVEKRVVFPCLLSPKLDGIRAVFHKGELYTRNKNVVRGVDHIKKALEGTGIESLDGELMVPGIPFQTSSGLIRSYNDTPDAVYYVFDIPQYEALQLGRTLYLQSLFGPVIASNHIQLVPHITADNMDDVSDAYALYRRLGYEGVMVKNAAGLYTDTRSAAWQKIKASETHDCKVIGFFEGQGRLTGTLGGLIVDFNEVPVRVGGGFSDFDRDMIWNDQCTYLGSMCEVEAQEVTPDGSMRHPRFITWRHDL